MKGIKIEPPVESVAPKTVAGVAAVNGGAQRVGYRCRPTIGTRFLGRRIGNDKMDEKETKEK